MAEVLAPPRLRAALLPRLYHEHERTGWLSATAVASIASELKIPLAEAWEAATSYPDFRFAPPAAVERRCGGLSCVLAGAAPAAGTELTHCQFRCYDAPAPGRDAGPAEHVVRLAGPLLAPSHDPGRSLAAVRARGREWALRKIEASGLRGRGGAYFPTARKWRAALAEERPIALVVNAEEGEPGIFKDRVLLGLRPGRFVEGLAIACEVLRPELTVVFINGEARAARASLEAALERMAGFLPGPPAIVPGGGGYVLGEETTMLNALEGRKPVPRLRPPYPVESGLFGMPTVVNNVETLANLSLVFEEGAAGFASRGLPDAPGTKLLSVSGRVQRPGLYEIELGAPLADVVDLAGGRLDDGAAALVGGPSGGFLPASEFGRPLAPGLLHPTGAIVGSGGVIVLDAPGDIRLAALAMAEYNARESCGKCTPCREGAPRLASALEAGATAGIDGLLEVVNLASLCGLGQMAPGPVRSALHFWPELFA
jgi:NADH:ubiquinone oxidoreductase subunit F (NADH-binding)